MLFYITGGGRDAYTKDLNYMGGGSDIGRGVKDKTPKIVDTS